MATNGKHRRHNIGRVALGVIRKFVPGVTKVVDADTDLEVSVTERDQHNSRKKDHADCAMAVATRRQESAKTDKKVNVIISASTAYVIKGNTATRYQVPGSVSREVVSFDRGAEFAAGDYKLKAVTASARLGHQSQAHGGPNAGTKSGVAATRFLHRTANIRDNLRNRVITAGE